VSAEPNPSTDKVRLDKWLWAARFFKTRSLAAAAVSGGKVHVNAARVKPAHAVRLGETLSIRRGPDEYVVVVKGLSRIRGPAAQAALLYEETPPSIQRREALVAERRLQVAPVPYPSRRPNKKDRRQIIRFTRQTDPPV
jgi:ribosome-associated heat shock protein Hsp15